MFGSMILAMLAALPTAHAGVAQPPVGAGGSFGDRASAFWIIPAPDETAGRTIYFAEVYQGLNSSRQVGVAILGLGTCISRKSEELCRGIAYSHELKPGEFKMSPLLDTARLDYTDKHHHVVQWQANDQTPTPATKYGIGEQGGAAESRLLRSAGAGGEVLGYVADPGVLATAQLGRGVAGGAAATLEPGLFPTSPRVDRQGRFHLTLRHS